MQPIELCEVCGREVPPAEAVKEELAVGDMMCPSPMTFHAACYDRARQIWGPDQSYCTVDPDFPETQRWTVPEPTER